MNEVTIKHIEDMFSGEHTGPHRFLDAGKGLGVTACEMKIMRMPPNWTDFPEQDHAEDGEEEVYVVLEGDAVLQTPDGETSLDPSTFVRISPGVRRKIVPGDVGATILAIAGKGVAGRPDPEKGS